MSNLVMCDDDDDDDDDVENEEILVFQKDLK